MNHTSIFSNWRLYNVDFVNEMISCVLYGFTAIGDTIGDKNQLICSSAVAKRKGLFSRKQKDSWNKSAVHKNAGKLAFQVQ